MSEPVEEHPWQRHYAKKREDRPAPTPLSQIPWAAGLSLEPVEEDARLIGEVAAKRPTDAEQGSRSPVETRIDWHSAPQVEVLTPEQRARAQAEAEARRWRDTLRSVSVIGALLGVLALAALGYEFLQRTLNRTPSDTVIADAGREIGTLLLQRSTAPALPLTYGGVQATLRAEQGAARRDYEFAITLRLSEPLYASADSNGAQAYLDLQRSVADAHARFTRARLHAQHPELAMPAEMPALLALTHRAGERYVLRVPVKAKRRVWGWELQPDLSGVVVAPNFLGDVIARSPAPHLIFGQAETREAMRALQQDARDYILAVQRALTQRD